MDKRTREQTRRLKLAKKAKDRYISKSENYKLHFIGYSLWLEGFTAGIRHARRIAKDSP